MLIINSQAINLAVHHKTLKILMDVGIKYV